MKPTMTHEQLAVELRHVYAQLSQGTVPIFQGSAAQGLMGRCIQNLEELGEREGKILDAFKQINDLKVGEELEITSIVSDVVYSTQDARSDLQTPKPYQSSNEG